MHRRATLLVSLLTFLLAAQSASAQGAWRLTIADFNSEGVMLRGVDASGLRVTPAAGGDERAVPYEQFLELTRAASSAQPTGKFILHMTGGDRLGGEPAGIKGNNLLWKSTSIGDVSIPMKRLVALTAGMRAIPEQHRDDVVTLSNGDTIHGIIATIADGKITIQTDAGPSEAPLASTVMVSFAATPAAAAQKSFRLRFVDGSSMIVPSITLNGDTFAVPLGQDAPRQIPISRIAAIEQVNGPVSWLSTRAPAEAVYSPYFGSDNLYPPKMDANYRGEEIRFRDERFTRGIGVHAYSRLSWNLDGAYAALRTRYAIDGDGPLADVTVRIYLDDKVVHQQEHVRAGQLSKVALIDLGQAKKLTLEVDFGANGAAQDRFNWIEPALMKVKPAESK